MTPKRPIINLAPTGLIIDRQEIGPSGIVVHAHGGDPSSFCTACGIASSAVHSRYHRRLIDLPAYGRRLTIQLSARRFRCRSAGCERKVFTERFGSGSVVMYARRSDRLDDLLHVVAVALGGRPAERLAHRLSTPVSAGTIICDVEKRCVIDLLPDREGATVAAWLKQRPDIEVVCRDRGVGFKEGATAGAPQALQVADRWHLLENATAAFLDVVRRHMGAIRQAVAHGDVDPETLSCAEKRQWTGFWRREEVSNLLRNLLAKFSPRSLTSPKSIIASMTIKRISPRVW